MGISWRHRAAFGFSVFALLLVVTWASAEDDDSYGRQRPQEFPAEEIETKPRQPADPSAPDEPYGEIESLPQPPAPPVVPEASPVPVPLPEFTPLPLPDAQPSPGPSVEPSLEPSFEPPPSFPPSEPSPLAPVEPGPSAPLTDAELRKLNEKAKPEKRWPAGYLGLRFGAGFGNAVIPSNATVPGSTSSRHIAPYLGIETLYGDKKWGASIGFDISPWMIKPDVLSGAPIHLTISGNANYFPNPTTRLVFGLIPYAFYRMPFSSDVAVHLLGVGAHATGYFKMSGVPGRPREAFVSLVFNRFTGANIRTSTSNTTVDVSSVFGNGSSTLVMLMLGFQLNFKYSPNP